MSEAGMLKFGVLRLDNKPVACIMCFDYNGCVYLYNSGYHPEYNYLSVGVLSKVMSIKESIKNGRKSYDFLKGSEPYKHHLGGKEVTLSRCLIDLK
jgi:CelD/BcsL family acetyltransferase involved in cellulose biosynthesis